MNDDRLKELLEQPPVPESLAARIHANWEQQLGQAVLQRRRRRLLALAASLFLTFGLWFAIPHTPDVIEAAYADIQKDAALHNGLSLDHRDWLRAHGIQVPSVAMRVEMSKYCNLSGYRTLHLRIAGEHQGIVHLFFHAGGFPSHWWERDTGRIAGMPWQAEAANGNLGVLVVATADIRPQAVDRLLQRMLAG